MSSVLGVATTSGVSVCTLLLTLTLLAHVPVIESLAQRCYVCAPRAGGSAEDFRDTFPGETLPGCEQFQVEDRRFMRDCPTEYKGCFTVTNGTLVTRTCSKLSVDDCKIANGIKYCYCRAPLCNREASPAQSNAPNDDEDLYRDPEGSGAGSQTPRHRELPGAASTTQSAPQVTPASAPPHVKSGVPSMQRTNVPWISAGALVMLMAASSMRCAAAAGV